MSTIRKLVSAAVLLAGAHGAAAQDTGDKTAAPPRLKELVTVSGSLVRIGDLVENAGSASDIPVFRAPDLGHTGSVGAMQVAAALRPHGIAALELNGLSEVVVTRLSRTVTARDVEERIARALSGQHGLGDAESIKVTFDRDVRTMHVEASATSDLSIARLSFDPRSARFDIMLELPGSSAARRMPMRFTGQAVETVETATLVRALQRGEVVRAADISVERRPKSEVAGDGIAADAAAGLAVKRAMRAGQALRRADLAKPDLVQRNESVTIHYDVPGIALTVRGKALESGGLGDVVNVTNIQSNRTVQGTVAGPGRVIVSANRPQFAAAAPAGSQQPNAQ